MIKLIINSVHKNHIFPQGLLPNRIPIALHAETGSLLHVANNNFAINIIIENVQYGSSSLIALFLVSSILSLRLVQELIFL